VRRALTYGPGDALTWALANGAVPPAAKDATHQPLYVDDLALVVVEADRVRGGVGDLAILLTLVGPTEVLLGGFADLLTAPQPSTPPPLDPVVVDLLARDLVVDGVMVGPTLIPDGLERRSWE
jgi:hypothetical protein